MSRIFGRAALLVVLGSSLAACASLRRPVEFQEYQGYLYSGSVGGPSPAGGMLFRPCEAAPGDSLWLAGFEAGAKEQRRRLDESGVTNLAKPLFVRVHATLKDPFQSPRAGIPGVTREMRVRWMIETRLSGSCQQA